MDELASGGGETFAAYFVKHLVGRQGYGAANLKELEPLAKLCDYLVVRTDGVRLAVTAIIDREAHPDKTFPVTPDIVQSVAEACLIHTGHVGRHKMPVILRVYEIGARIIDTAATDRLAPYKKRDRGSKVALSAWLLDTTLKQAWTNMRLAGLGPRQATERLLRSARLSQVQLEPRRLAIATTRRPPAFTLSLIALLCVIFGVEVDLSLDKLGGFLAPSLRTLAAMGGVGRSLVLDSGQWWRIFTAPLLHADVSHVGFNCLALFLIGRLLEPLIGARWMAGVFAVSAVCGSLLSIVINAPNIVGIGASGGIVGLFAAALITVSRIPAGPQKSRLMGQAIYGLVPALLPFLNGASHGATNIDYGAHFGGALGGVVMSLILLWLWPDDIERPRRPNIGAAIAIGFFACAALAILPVSLLYWEQTALVPVWPASGDDIDAKAPQLALDYPHDPRARLANALVLEGQNQNVKAQAELRAALAETDILRDDFTPKFEGIVRGALAVNLYDSGDKDEAKQIADPVCKSVTGLRIYDRLKERALCP